MIQEECHDFTTYMRFIMETHVLNNFVFKPQVYYNRDGDQFEIYWKDDPYYAEQINTDGTSQFSLHKSIETNEIVGVTLYSVKHRLKKESMLTRELERVYMDQKFGDWLAKQGDNK